MYALFSTALVFAFSQAVEIPQANGDSVDIDIAYAEHMTKHGFSYESVDEYEVHKARYAEVDAIIRAHNSMEGISFTMAHNRFSDWSAEDWGVTAAPTTADVEEERPLGDDSGTVKVFNADNLEASIDWRSTSNVSSYVYD